MSRIETLNAAVHRDLMLAPDAGRASWRGFVELVTTEFVAAAAHYPLFFSKNKDTGRFTAGMLHGIRSGEPRNRPSDDNGIDFTPAALTRQGFFAVGDHLGVDLDHPRLIGGAGRPLFELDGQPTVALQEVQQAVALLKRGGEPTLAFVQALLHHQLIEPIAISLDFDDGERLTLDGLYTVSLDRLAGLDDAAVLALFRADHLRLAHVMAASLPHLTVLAHHRNRGWTTA